MRAAPLLLTTLVVACAEGPSGTTSSSASSGRPPNLLLLSIDTLRADHLGCYGYERPTSPTIDILADEGTLFEDASASSPWTAPSHATMLTGLYPAHHGVLNLGFLLPEETLTLAEDLERAGYVTLAAVNSINIGLPQMAFDQGFAEFRWIEETERTPDGELRVPNTGRAVLATAFELLDGRDAGRPFFLFLHVYDVHADYAPERHYRESFVGPYDGALTGTTTQLREVLAGRVAVGDDDVRWLVETYDAEIRQVDDLVADLLAGLEARGVRDDTVLVLTSDHGEEFWERGGVGHARTQYQEMLAIPLIFVGPSVPRGQRIAAPVGLVDLAPTLLGLAGVPSLAKHDGVDLRAWWESPQRAPQQRPIFAGADLGNFVDGVEVANTRAMVRVGQEKLHVDRLTMKTRLYDLGADPGEREDLAAKRPQVVRRLMGHLARLLEGEVDWSVRPELSEDELERLEALGYLGDE